MGYQRWRLGVELVACGVGLVSRSRGGAWEAGLGLEIASWRRLCPLQWTPGSLTSGFLSAWLPEPTAGFPHPGSPQRELGPVPLRDLRAQIWGLGKP